MDKNTKNMWVIAILTILAMAIIAFITLSQTNKMAEQNREDVKNLINEELKKLNEEQLSQGQDIEILVDLSEPKPIIDCWLSKKDNEKQTYEITITNNGNKLAQLENIKLESTRNYYRPITTKNFDSEVTLCELKDKWLSPGKIIVQRCFSDFEINHIILNTKTVGIICDLDRR